MPGKISEKKTKIPMFVKSNRKKIIIGVIVIVVLVSVYLLKSLFIVATVNGEPILRTTFTKELEKKDGKQVLNSLVTKSLILQEANKQKVTLTDTELAQEIKSLEDSLTKQGQNLDQLLQAQGMTRADLNEQIKMQKTIEKLIGKDVKVTDKEIQDYIDKNKDSFPESNSADENKKVVKQQLEQQKLSDKFQTWIADLEKKAKINYFVNL